MTIHDEVCSPLFFALYFMCFFCYDLEEDGFGNGEGGLVLLLLLPLQVGRHALPATLNT
jgi:hypothetical protein